ncbi:MAG TPA: glycosyltransferase family 2 protein [Puia sp.]|nr:glycosyltransferase family 2 protein [Puia sp.]
MSTYIIIPAFNESSGLNAVLESLLPLKYGIIVIDDGSSDGTDKIAGAFPVLLIRHELNLGQGAALETGMEAARRLNADFVIHFDADGQHDPSDIEQLLVPLQEGKADIVFGSRFLEKKPSGLSLSKKIILKTGRWINYLITGILLTDAHNGLRALNKKALHSIHFHQPGMAHASEILYEVRRKSLRYLEQPVQISYTDYSKRKGQTLLNSVNILFHLFFKK